MKYTRTTTATTHHFISFTSFPKLRRLNTMCVPNEYILRLLNNSRFTIRYKIISPHWKIFQFIAVRLVSTIAIHVWTWTHYQQCQGLCHVIWWTVRKKPWYIFPVSFGSKARIRSCIGWTLNGGWWNWSLLFTHEYSSDELYSFVFVFLTNGFTWILNRILFATHPL